MLLDVNNFCYFTNDRLLNYPKLVRIKRFQNKFCLLILSIPN